MMDELISREDALKALDEMSYKSPHESATSVVRKKHFGEILEKFIMQQPSAQKKGHWNFVGDNLFKCTCCGEMYTTQQLNGLRVYDKDPYCPFFCPHCGADMREEEE